MPALSFVFLLAPLLLLRYAFLPLTRPWCRPETETDALPLLLSLRQPRSATFRPASPSSPADAALWTHAYTSSCTAQHTTLFRILHLWSGCHQTASAAATSCYLLIYKPFVIYPFFVEGTAYRLTWITPIRALHFKYCIRGYIKMVTVSSIRSVEGAARNARA